MPARPSAAGAEPVSTVQKAQTGEQQVNLLCPKSAPGEGAFLGNPPVQLCLLPSPQLGLSLGVPTQLWGDGNKVMACGQ